MTKFKVLLYIVTVVAIIFISVVINWYFVVSLMNHEILSVITIITHLGSVLFLFFVLVTRETSTLQKTNSHQPLWFGFCGFVVIAAGLYLVEGKKGDGVLFANSGELVCVTGLALLYVIRYVRKRQTQEISKN